MESSFNYFKSHSENKYNFKRSKNAHFHTKIVKQAKMIFYVILTPRGNHVHATWAQPSFQIAQEFTLLKEKHTLFVENN